MKDKKYIIIIYILLFLLIIIILLTNYKNIELYENKNKLLISPWNGTDFKIYNDNFDKFWYKKGIDYPINNKKLDLPKIFQKIGDNTYNFGFLNLSYIFQYILTKKNLLKNIKFKEYNLSNDKLSKINKKTWLNNEINNYDPNVSMNFKYINSYFKEVDIINTDFIDKINKYQSKLLSKNNIIKFGTGIYQIIKYYILKIFKSNNILKFYLIVVLFKENSLFCPTIALNAYVINNTVYYLDIELIGNYTTGKILLLNGIEYNTEYKKISDNMLFGNDNILTDIDTVIKIRKKYLDKFKLRNQYSCFNANPSVYENINYKDSIFLNFYDKLNCENRYSWLGQDKDSGVWDRPCKKDKDCSFYNLNKNYPNNYGGCNKDTGYCELPINSKPLGYKYYNKLNKNKPFCYNCNTKEWKPVTSLNDCCNEQNDRKKYPFLNSPDYAYKRDFQNRMNYYNSKKCRTTYIDKNNPNNNVIKCD